MKRGTIWIALTCLMVISLVLVSCTKTTSTTTTTSKSTTTTTTTTKTTTTTTAPPTSTTSTTTTATTGNWWDSLGKPQYGGEMVLSTNSNIVNFDPYNGTVNNSMNFGWMEQIFGDDWTLNPNVYDYKLSFRPPDYAGGCLAKSWEFTVPTIFVVHLYQGIHWQNIPPVNGREFTADDVVYHYDRMLGLGNGFTKVSPWWSSSPFISLTTVTAIDKYTVAFTWNAMNPESISENMEAASIIDCMEAPETVKQWGDLNDWHHAIGTGPFILTDFVSDSSMTLVKNPSYWAYDERYPQNQLPYVNKITVLVITNKATALAAMRTGKLDYINQPTLQQVQIMQKTNPEITAISCPGAAIDVDPRDDMAPFKDIRVRIAMQKAIDMPTIASNYYGGTANPTPQTLTSYYIKGWGWPYDLWPQSLKDEYTYDPTAAKKLLADAGYPNGFKTNIVVDNANDLDLVQIVKSYFLAVGIDMEIRPMDAASLNTYLLTAHKNDGLAQRSNGKIGRTMAPLRVLTQFQVGDQVNYEMWNDPVFNAFAPAANAATSIDAIKKIDADANEYVARQHIEICVATPNTFTLCQPWLKGYTGQNYAFSNLLNQYGARCWIDQNVKKSLGH